MTINRSRRPAKLIVPIVVFLFLLGLIFLPGPNGLISILLKLYHINRSRNQLQQLRARADSLSLEIKLWQDPTYATRQAQKIFSPTSSDTLP